jgi:hypothetical protein
MHHETGQLYRLACPGPRAHLCVYYLHIDLCHMKCIGSSGTILNLQDNPHSSNAANAAAPLHLATCILVKYLRSGLNNYSDTQQSYMPGLWPSSQPTEAPLPGPSHEPILAITMIGTLLVPLHTIRYSLLQYACRKRGSGASLTCCSA